MANPGTLNRSPDPLQVLTYLQLSNIFLRLDQPNRALETLQRGAARCPPRPAPSFSIISLSLVFTRGWADG